MDHKTELATAIDRAFAVLECESTPAELGPHVTREHVNILRDLASWANDVIAARPRIKPAKVWMTPTEGRLRVARRIAQRSRR